MKVANGPQSARVDLVGLSEYQQASGDQMVIVRVPDTTTSGPDVYVSFNRASGINEGTETG